jgi:hypothetical protein
MTLPRQKVPGRPAARRQDAKTWLLAALLCSGSAAPAAIGTTQTVPPSKTKATGFCEAAAGVAEPQRFTYAMLDEAMLAVNEKLGTRLAASVVPKERALGLYLAVNAGAGRQGVEQLGRLVELATSGGDGDIYGLAFAQCFSLSATPATPDCARLTVEKWRQLEPLRFEPLIAKAKLEWRRGDAAAVERAMAAVLLYPGSYAVRSPAHSLVQTAALQALPEHERRLALMSITAANSTYAMAPLVGAYCAKTPLLAPQRRQQCQVLAEKMIEESGSVLDSYEGMKLAKELGWPKETMKLAGKNTSTLRKGIRKQQMAGAAASCDYLRQLGDLARDTLEQGEFAAYRRFLGISQP